MKEAVYLFEPNPVKGIEYFIERNTGLAKYFAKVTGRDFGGEFKRERPIPENAFWFLHGTITPEEADELHINDSNFYGGITDLLYAQKSVFHLPLPNAEYIPANFPLPYVDSLHSKDILLPGYTAFTAKDILRAYELLDHQGYVVRLKEPLQSTKRGQYRIESKQHLQGLVEKLNTDLLAQYGIVLEVNMIPHDKTGFESTSGCWSEIDGQTYTYMGFMNFEENATPFSYVGTDMQITRKGTPALREFFSDKYQRELKMLDVFREANVLLPNFRATRCNYNFIQGSFETKNGSDGLLHVYATEPTYRPGGATVAELLGKEFLDSHADQNVVRVRSRFNYGRSEEEAGINDGSVVIHRSRYSGPGRDGQDIDIPVQIFGELVPEAKT